MVKFTKFDLLDLCSLDEATYLIKILWNNCPSKQVQKRLDGKLKFMSIFHLDDAINSCKTISNYADKESQERLLFILTKYKDSLDGTSKQI